VDKLNPNRQLDAKVETNLFEEARWIHAFLYYLTSFYAVSCPRN